MGSLYYCLDCKRVFEGEGNCKFCSSAAVKELNENSPVNVLGTKIKGKVMKAKDGKVRLLIIDENNTKHIKEYDVEKLKKIL